MNAYFEDNEVKDGHARDSLHSGAVSLAARAVNALIQIGSVLFLARLLSPEDYGLVSMVVAITGFAPLVVDLGSHDAIVQRTSVSEGEVSALFWITISIGCTLALSVAATGPLIARFYGDPRLTMIALVSSLTFIASALQCQHYALLQRAMRFREISLIEVGANLLSAAFAVTMALYGFRYWALVLRPIAQGFLLAVGVWWRSRWLPGKPTITSGVKEMVRFGLNLTGFTMADFIGGSSDRVAIGYTRGATTLGFYQNADFVYDNLLSILVAPLHGVGVAGLSKLRGNLKELRRLWAKALSTLAFFSMPAFGLLAVTSRDLIVMLLGTKWSSAGLLLSVLALRGIPQSIERTLGWLHVTAGRTDRWMRWGVIGTCAHLVALGCGLPFGLMGVVVAYVICMFILFIPAIAYAGAPLAIRAADVVKVVCRPLVGSLISTAVGFLLRYTLLVDASMIARTSALVCAYVACYLIIVVGLFRLRMPVSVLLSLIRDYLPARFARFARTPRFLERHGYEQI